jgi:hypothetical protein
MNKTRKDYEYVLEDLYRPYWNILEEMKTDLKLAYCTYEEKLSPMLDNLLEESLQKDDLIKKLYESNKQLKKENYQLQKQIRNLKKK